MSPIMLLGQRVQVQSGPGRAITTVGIIGQIAAFCEDLA